MIWRLWYTFRGRIIKAFLFPFVSHLEDINTTLEGMALSDLEYLQATADYQDQMLEMQAVNTATNIFICIGVFAVFGSLVFQQFLGRFK